MRSGTHKCQHSNTAGKNMQTNFILKYHATQAFFFPFVSTNEFYGFESATSNFHLIYNL